MRIFGLVSLLAAISHVLASETQGDLELLLMGNKVFRDNIAATDPGLLQRLADEGQCMRHPSIPACRMLT